MRIPYIIAEIGINHEGKTSNIKKLIYSAKRAGANAVKFQLFEAETLSDKESKIRKSFYYKKKETLYQMWKRLEITDNQLKIISDITKNINIDLIFSIFDARSLNRIKKLKIKIIKIASGDITDLILLKKINSLKIKKIILSTGMSNLREIKNALKILKNKKVILMHCVSLYPCELNKVNMKRMINLKETLKKTIGFSDHAVGITACMLAIAMGAKFIEKHFTLDKKQNGPDHKLSADEEDLKIITNFAQNYNIMQGNGSISPSKEEFKIRKIARKSIYLKKNLKKNHIINSEDLEIRRPGGHFQPIHIEKIIGKKTKKFLRSRQNFKPRFI